ncbi:MAG: metallopeptidase TldD-related protein [Pseudobdellovibrio sp.]
MMQTYINTLSQKLFNLLTSDEQLGMFLHSEDSTFVRFNKSQVRQNTTVNQHELSLQFNKQERTIKMRYNLTLDLENDIKTGKSLIETAREQLMFVDRDPKFISLKNNGNSESFKNVSRPSDSEIPKIIHDTFADSDLAGLWTSGPVRQVSINSEGQNHFFESDFFFLDYSLYNGSLAAKGYYSEENFSLKNLQAQSSFTKNKLSLLNRPPKNVPRGKYTVYLEPMAVTEILGTLSWGSFSQSNYNQGYAPLRKLKEKQTSLSPLVSLSENLGLGYTPNFNSLGEIAPAETKLVTQGELKSLLVSTATAKEYNLTSTFAEPSEIAKSLELRAGTLQNNKILSTLNNGLYLSNLHYINYSDIQSARITGMTRFACFWVENGEIVSPIQDLRFDESIFNILGQNLIQLTTEQSTFVDVGTYGKRSLGAIKTPGALIKNFNFTL